jgi:hypothetical protein
LTSLAAFQAATYLRGTCTSRRVCCKNVNFDHSLSLVGDQEPLARHLLAQQLVAAGEAWPKDETAEPAIARVARAVTQPGGRTSIGRVFVPLLP